MTLIGTKGVGKDTIGVYLTGYTKRAFATPIKEACAILFNVPITSFEGELKEVLIIRLLERRVSSTANTTTSTRHCQERWDFKETYHAYRLQMYRTARTRLDKLPWSRKPLNTWMSIPRDSYSCMSPPKSEMKAMVVGGEGREGKGAASGFSLKSTLLLGE